MAKVKEEIKLEGEIVSEDKKVKADEVVYTDILEEYFMENKIEMVKRTYKNGDAIIKEEIVKNK